MKIIFLILLELFHFTIYSVDFDEAAQKEIIDAINTARREVSPPGADIREVRWSSCYAKVAAQYLATCPGIGQKNQERQTIANNLGCEASDESVGETMYYTPNELTSNTQAIESWASQKSSFDYSTDSCSYICGDYVQMIWSQTYVVGCAKYDLTNCGETGTAVLCDYGISIYMNSKPYVEGDACTACGDWPGCDEGLCTQESAAGTTNGVFCVLFIVSLFVTLF